MRFHAGRLGKKEKVFFPNDPNFSAANKGTSGIPYTNSSPQNPEQPAEPNPEHAIINIIYTNTYLHFKNFPHKLKFLAMLNSFTGRITTTLPDLKRSLTDYLSPDKSTVVASLVVIVVIIGVVVSVPV
jgi:hypothetical protein